MADNELACEGSPSATCTAVTSTAESRTAPPKQTECHLLQLPPELRNRIFDLALGGEDIISDFTTWPAITGTCKQIRAETLRMYLARPFVAHIKDLNEKPLVAWLDALQQLDDSLPSLVTSVTLVSEGQLLDTGQPAFFKPAPTIFVYLPNFDFWDSIIEKLRATGFTARQLIWPGLDATTLSSLRSKKERYQYLVQLQALNTYVLRPLLIRRELFDPTKPPVGIAEQVRREWAGLGLESNAEHELLRLRQSYGCGEACMWFRYWSVNFLEPSDGEDGHA